MMKIDGGCHCGNITYTAEIDPETVGICHCTDCQTLSGTAFRTSVRANKETFHLAGGQPKIYVKTAESGAKRAQAFCPECGTSLLFGCGKRPAGFQHPPRHGAPARGAAAEIPGVVPIRARLGI